MMKKIMAVLLVCALGIGTVASPMGMEITQAEELIIPDGIQYEVGADGITITEYEGSETELVIPDEIERRKVTSIGESAFAHCSSLTIISLPNSLTSIESSAFSDCSSLTSINLPDSVTSIGSYSFWGCKALTSIKIPISVTNIGDAAFSGCSNLTDISLPDSVMSIGERAFSDCSSLTSINLPDGITSIGGEAFLGTPWLDALFEQNEGLMIFNNVVIAADAKKFQGI